MERCNAEMIETVKELLVLQQKGHLDQLFPILGIRSCVEEALDAQSMLKLDIRAEEEAAERSKTNSIADSKPADMATAADILASRTTPALPTPPQQNISSGVNPPVLPYAVDFSKSQTFEVEIPDR